MQHSMVATTFSLDGFRVVKNLGMIRGITVRSLTAGNMFKGSFQLMAGGRQKLLSELCEKARTEAFDLMIQHAEELDANAILGVRYDATSIAEYATEVLCYGTAVQVEPA